MVPKPKENLMRAFLILLIALPLVASPKTFRDTGSASTLLTTFPVVPQISFSKQLYSIQVDNQEDQDLEINCVRGSAIGSTLYTDSFDVPKTATWSTPDKTGPMGTACFIRAKSAPSSGSLRVTAWGE